MALKRIIARLDVKNNTLIKGLKMEGLRVVGEPVPLATDYYLQGIDEILYIDAVASLYGRNSLLEIVESTSRQVFVPMTVGGGIRSIEDAQKVLASGADKVAVNTAFVQRPELVGELVSYFGSQCVVGSVHVKAVEGGKYQAYTEYGREATGLDAVEWVRELIDRGVGEVLLTSVDRDGMKCGFDLDFIELLGDLSVPVVLSGGCGDLEHALGALGHRHVDAIALASALHYKTLEVSQLKLACEEKSLAVRIWRDE